MLAILNSLNVHNLPIFQPILMLLVTKFMFYITLSYKTYLSLGLLSPLNMKKSYFNSELGLFQPFSGSGLKTPRVEKRSNYS